MVTVGHIAICRGSDGGVGGGKVELGIAGKVDHAIDVSLQGAGRFSRTLRSPVGDWGIGISFRR